MVNNMKEQELITWYYNLCIISNHNLIICNTIGHCTLNVTKLILIF